MERFTKVGLVGLALVLALAACTKSTETSTSTTTTTEASASPESSMAAAPANGAAASDGAKVYSTNCSSCHQASGQGVEGTFPPLAGNPVVTGDPKKVIGIVKNGLNGKIEVKGHSYNGMMPAWGQQLSDGDIAAVVTYVRSSWGNKAGAVNADQVKAVTK